jgi:hypothetical protein
MENVLKTIIFNQFIPSVYFFFLTLYKSITEVTIKLNKEVYNGIFM